MNEQPAQIIVKNLNKSFRIGDATISVFENISFEVLPNEFFCIVGPSGCGKSTLLNILSGLLEPDAGEIRIDSESLDNTTRRKIGYVFQEPRLLPWRDVLANVKLGLEAQNLSKDEMRTRAVAQIQLTGLSDFIHAYPHQLSGGMRQRVALARGLATNPEILLMDEPFGSLDFHTRHILHRELLSLWESNRRTIVFVTHDPYEAVYLADRILILSQRPAVIEKCKTIDLPRPRKWQDPKVIAVYFETLKEIGYVE